jgi:hypothetical protein
MDYLSQKGVSFTSKDIASDQAAFEEFATLNSPGTPTIVVDKEIVVGFDRRRLDALLAASPPG